MNIIRRWVLVFAGHLALLLAVGESASALPNTAALPNSAVTESRLQELRPFLLGGIQTHEKDHQRWTAALHQAGMNAVQVTVYAQQGPWNTAKLWYAEEEPAVLKEIRTARQNGLQVVLILRVALHHGDPENRFLWHGLTYPETERATRDWFRTYTDFVVKWGRIAEREGVEVLGIASEMNSLAATLPVRSIPALPAYYLDDGSQERLRKLVKRSEHLFDESVRMGMGAGDFHSLDDFLIERNRAERTWARAYTFAEPTESSPSALTAPAEGDDVSSELDPKTAERLAAINHRRGLLDRHWRRLIRKVRRGYSGRLTLAANFDNYHEVGFWDALDLIGINAYFPLRETLDEPVSEAGLQQAWREIFEQIEVFRKEQALRQEVVFTELGYTRWEGVTVAPWSSQGFIPMWDPEGEIERDWAFFWAAQPVVPGERALAIQALHQVWREESLPLSGVLYWKLSSLPELQRFEPFMLHLGAGSEDPSYAALTRFATGIRPFGPQVPHKDLYSRVAEATIRADIEGLKGLAGKATKLRRKNREPLLHLATRLGHRDVVEWLIEEGSSLVERDAGGLLPIHWTCFQDDPELVDLVLPGNESPLLDASGETPLMKCARLDNHRVLTRLLERRRDLVPVRNARGQSALHLAADQGSLATVEALVAAGGDAQASEAEHGATPMHIAARRGDPAILRALAGKSRTARTVLDAYGNRPVQWAAYHGSSQAFELLFEASEAGRLNPEDQGLLHFAAHGGSLEILRAVLEHAPEIDPVDHEGQTPLFLAIQGVHPQVVELLLQQGASVAQRNGDGLTPLHLAAASPNPEILQKILDREINFDLDMVDDEGNTALHHATGWGHLENLRRLLAAGSDTALRNADGETPLAMAQELGRRRVIELLAGSSK